MTRAEASLSRVAKAVGFACVSTILALSTGCQKQDPPAFERPPAPVTVVAAVTQDVPVYLDEVGKCVAREVVTVQPQVSGKITEIHFTDGADIKKGALLFTIDPRPFQAQLDAATANLAQAKAAMDLAKIQLSRYADLLKAQVVAQQDYDTRQNAVEVNQAQIDQNQAAVDTAKLNLEYTSIRSPIDGRAGHRLVDTGNVVTANMTSLLAIERMDPIYADFTIAENDLSAVQEKSVKGPLTVSVALPDEPNKPITGQLTFLDNAVQNTTGTVMLRATVPNSERRLWPGRFVNVRLVLNTVPHAIVIPASAPQLSATGSFVYVVKPDSTAESRAVKLGQRQGDLVVIDEGVKAGDQVIITGQTAVTPGGKVRIQQEPAQENPPTPKTGGQS